MYRIDDATAASSLPTPETAGAEGYFTEGDPVAGLPATNVRGSWLNMIQEELCSILAAAGIARSKTSYSQVNASLQKMYSPIVGAARNLAMSVSAAAATATLMADQIIVASALGGQTFVLSNFNKTINLGTTGAGGIDAGVVPASGYVALYAIYNPTTNTSALLATNATGAVQPNVYGGAYMPAGYTASALVSVWPTNGSSQLVAGFQTDRKICIANINVLSTTTVQASVVPLSIASAVPPNARTARGFSSIGTSASNAYATFNAASSAAPLGMQQFQGQLTNSFTMNVTFDDVQLITQQTMYYAAIVNTGTMSANIYISGYTI
ncbi:hypothetical protein OHZ10_29130 [Burkholderia arboris]|uniref:Tail protein n=1 Tax=Burkholderia arboris TaxID=488730 RepID=A0ABZ3DN69_9BURK